MKRSIKIGPLAIFFTNINTSMGLPGHSHYAEVALTFETLGLKGFPAFAKTYAALQEKLIELTATPFRGATNEDIADALYLGLEFFAHPDIDEWNCKFRLETLELRVRGVPDRIGHADGFTTYSVTRE